MRRDGLWIVPAAVLVAAVAGWLFLTPKSGAGGRDVGQNADHAAAVMMPRSELNPDTDPPSHAQLMYIAPPLIPVDVKTERKGQSFTINLYDHGELFDFEKYVSNEEGFFVSQAAGEDYVPPLPILLFPINVGGPALSWRGTLSSELSPHPASASIQVWADKVTVGDAAVATIRSDVEITIEAHDHSQSTERRLTFWFQPGKGLIKRQFGTTSAREPVGP